MTYADFMTSRRRDKAATKAALLEAARRRFAQHGFDGTGVRDIAADAGVDPTLIFRYFGSKQDLFTAAVHTEVPPGLGRGADPAVLARLLVRDVVFTDAAADGGEHPLLVMLRSAGRPEVRARLREAVCGDYLAAFAEAVDAPDAALRAELVGAFLLGMGLMRSVVGTPELSEAEFADVDALVDAVAAALTRP